VKKTTKKATPKRAPAKKAEPQNTAPKVAVAVPEKTLVLRTCAANMTSHEARWLETRSSSFPGQQRLTAAAIRRGAWGAR
jgi:hypothetical protein